MPPKPTCKCETHTHKSLWVKTKSWNRTLSMDTTKHKTLPRINFSHLGYQDSIIFFFQTPTPKQKIYIQRKCGQEKKNTWFQLDWSILTYWRSFSPSSARVSGLSWSWILEILTSLLIKIMNNSNFPFTIFKFHNKNTDLIKIVVVCVYNYTAPWVGL